MRRRDLLLSSLALPFISSARAMEDDGFLAPIVQAVKALNGPGLIKSYITDGQEAFDQTHAQVAYVYDNAMAGLALASAGYKDLAQNIGEGLMLAQRQDRHWRDGRLRNAYIAGPQKRWSMPGWWDARQKTWLEDGYAVGSGTGPNAFAILLWTTLGTPAMKEAASKTGDWIAKNCFGARGFTGGTLGHEPDPTVLRWVSTEQNVDLTAAFTRLDRKDFSDKAAHFVREMWLTHEKRWAAGITPQGHINGESAVDANLWPLLVQHPFWADLQGSMDWVLAHHESPGGLDFNSDRDGLWMEGTAQAALVLQRLGNPQKAEAFLQTLRQEQRSDGWIWASSVPWLTTGFYNGDQPFLYPRRGHIAANAWASLAQNNKNPFALDFL